MNSLVQWATSSIVDLIVLPMNATALSYTGTDIVSIGSISNHRGSISRLFETREGQFYL